MKFEWTIGYATPYSFRDTMALTGTYVEAQVVSSHLGPKQMVYGVPGQYSVAVREIREVSDED